MVQMKEDTYQYHPVLPQLEPLVNALTKVYKDGWLLWCV